MIESAISAALTTLFLVWLHYSVQHDRSVPAGKVEYGRAVRYVVYFFWLCIAVGAVIAIVNPPNNPKDLALLRWIGPIAILGVAVCHAETFFVSVSLQDNTLRTLSPWRPSRIVDVADIDRLRYSHLLQSYVIDTRFDGKIYLPVTLSGLRSFLLRIESVGYPIPENTPLYIRPFVD